MKYEGATAERFKKDKIAVTARSREVGGDVGHTVENPLLIDKLDEAGFLGSEHHDKEARYTSGYRLRALWFGFNSSATEETTMPKGRTGMYQFEADEVSGADMSRQKFNEIMGCVPSKYHKTLYDVCIDERHREVCRMVRDSKTGKEYVVCDKTMIVEALDALWGVFRALGYTRG